MTWAEFVEAFRRPAIRADKDGPLFSPAIFTRPRRLNENVHSLSMLVLDFDHDISLTEALEVCEGLGVDYLIYTTHSHQRVTDRHPTPEDCFRVVLPLKELIPSEDFPYLFKWAEAIFDHKVDTSRKDLCGMFYLPAVYSPDSRYEFYAKTDGAFLDWRGLEGLRSATLRSAQTQGACPLQPPTDAVEECVSTLSPPPPAGSNKGVTQHLSSASVTAGGVSQSLTLDDITYDKSNGFEVWKAKLIVHISNHPGSRLNRSGRIDAPGLCHGSEKGTAVFCDPRLNSPTCNEGCGITCNKGCGIIQIAESYKYPPPPKSEPQPPSVDEPEGDSQSNEDKAGKQQVNNDSESKTEPPKTPVSPSRFIVTDDGVYVKAKKTKGKDKWLCSPLFITARTRDEQGGNAGLRLEWKDFDGKTRHWNMSRGLLAGEGSAIREHLLSNGFGRIASGRGSNSEFIDYLMSAIPEKVVMNTSRIGWHNGSYILPDETIGEPNGEETVLQSSVNDYRLAVKGTLEEWKENVGKYCEGNSRLIFATSIGLAGPLLRPLGQEGGGFHFRGQSSKGKSTAVTVAGSVYGGGDPTLGYARTWANTANALEAVAEMHNDGLLVLDELARCDPRDAGNVAYMLASGNGKGRLQSSIEMREPFKWQLMFISTGEISLADHAATAGKKTRAGQEVRLCDLLADTVIYGVFENLHGFEDGAKFAKALQQNSRNYYGAPLRAYLAKLTQLDWEDTRKEFQGFESEFIDEVLKDTDEVSGEVSRVASRFALVAYAGEVATKSGITGWTEGKVSQAALKLFKEWLENRGGTGNADEEVTISKVRQFIAEYGPSRFETSSSDQRVIGKRAGFVIESEDGEAKQFCILADTFKNEVCSGYDSKMVCAALHKRGWLRKGPDGKNSMNQRAPFDKTQHRVYVINSDILGG
jgi:uncharacterized protein (DUF927 family)